MSFERLEWQGIDVHLHKGSSIYDRLGYGHISTNSFLALEKMTLS
jgi:hypothetical protein